jgi:O-antigen ligase
MRRRSRRSSGGNPGGTTALPEWRGERIGVLGGLREAILAVMCGVMPWWFGSADPPAIFVMSILILALAAVTLIDGFGPGRRNELGLIDCLTCLPVLALGLAALYGLLQWAELGPDLLGTLSPARFERWKRWGGGESLVLRTEPGITMPSPAARLSWLGAETYESVVWVAALWVLGVCVLRLPGRWGPLKRHSMVMGISGTLMALQSMLQALTWKGNVLWLRPKGIITTSSGPFFVHSELAAYLNLSLGFLLAKLLFGRLMRDPQALDENFLREGGAAPGKGALAIYPAGIGILAVLASGSRGGFLSMMLGMMVLGVIALRARLKAGIGRDDFLTGGGGGMTGWYAILGLLGVVAFGLTMLVDVFAVFGRVESLVSGGGSHAAGIRLAVWKLATEVWKQAPVWGTGWGSFYWASQPVIESTELGFVTHAESDYVQVLPEGGLIGASIVLAGILGLFRSGLVLVRGTDRPTQIMLTAGALSGLTAVAWGALTENVLRTPGIVIPALVTAAQVARLAVSIRREKTEMAETTESSVPGSKSGAVSRLAGVTLGLVLTATAWPNCVGTRTMSQAWASMEQSGIQHAGVQFPDWSMADMKDERLERERAGTQAIESILPGWGDYHIRRSLAEVETFQRRTLA